MDTTILGNGKSNTLVMMTGDDLKFLAKTMLLEVKKELENEIADGKSDRLVTIEQAAGLLGVNRSTLWKWDKKGYLKSIQIGNKRRYRLSDVNAIIAGRH